MAEFNNNNQISPGAQPQSKLIQALQIVFGRSSKQLDIVKGKDQPQEKYGSFDSIENRLSKIFTGYTDIQYDRITKYRDYDRMDTASTECQTGLDIYAEEASQKDDKSGLRVWIESDDDNLAEELNGMLQRTRTEFKAYGLYRNLAKYGDCFIYLMPGGYGIHDYQFVHPSRIERMQQDGLLGFKSPELANHLPTDNRLGIFKPWDLIHMRITAYDQESVYGRCYDDKTEILTRNGWVLFKDLPKNVEVATRNPITKEFEWQLPTAYTEQDYNGEMFHFKSRSVDMLVTPNHRMLVKTQRSIIEKIVEASELEKAGSHVKIPMTSTWKGTKITGKCFVPEVVASSTVCNRTVSSQEKGLLGWKGEYIRKNPPLESYYISGDNFCALMGAYLSEGNIRSAGGIEINQRDFSKGYLPYKALIEDITAAPAQYNGKAFVIPKKVLTSYFRQFGHASNKFIPEEIMNATPTQLKIFWEYFILGDGNVKERPVSKSDEGNPQPRITITTTSKKMADQLVEIAQKIGISASLTTVPAHEKEMFNRGYLSPIKESYIIKVRQSKEMNFKVTKTSYNGKIYCVQVPNTIVYVRRNGFPAWCGNSFLESVRKVYKQLSMLDTMLVLYRIAKAVQRNIFYVDVGQASVAETTSLVKDYERFLKNKQQFIDPKTNEFKLEFNPATILQDIVWPIRPGSLSKVEQLQNTSSIGPLEDVDYFRNKIRLGLNIPKEYFDGETASGMWNSREALMLQDARFGRKITKLQDALREGIIKLCQIHWAIAKGEYLPPDAFIVQLGTISSVADRQREDILLRKAQIIEILANISVVMGWNRWVWGDYLLDEVFPLPAQLRAKLQTPDPVMQAEFEKQKELTKDGAQGRAQGAMKAIKPNKPPKKTTADNVKKGLRSFGYGEDLLAKVPELLEEFQQIEEKIKKPFYITEASMLGFSKDELVPLINNRVEVVASMQNTKIDYKILHEMNKPPEQTLNKKEDPLSLTESLEKEFLND